MTKYLMIWHQNPMVPTSMDPEKSLALNEKMWAALDDMKKKGTVLEFGYFLDGTSGYAIGEGTGEMAFRATCMFLPYVIQEVYEIISYEKGKEIVRELCKAGIRAARQSPAKS